MDNHQELIKQILYYFSDDNLSVDQFFYDKVTEKEYLIVYILEITLLM